MSSSSLSSSSDSGITVSSAMTGTASSTMTGAASSAMTGAASSAMTGTASYLQGDDEADDDGGGGGGSDEEKEEGQKEDDGWERATTVGSKSSAATSFQPSKISVYSNAESYSTKASPNPSPKQSAFNNQDRVASEYEPSTKYSRHSRRSTIGSLAAKYEIDNGNDEKHVGFEGYSGNNSDSYNYGGSVASSRRDHSSSSRGHGHGRGQGHSHSHSHGHLKLPKQRPGAGVNFAEMSSMKSSTISEVLDNLQSIESIFENNQVKAPGCQVPSYDQVNVDEVKFKLHGIMNYLDTTCMASGCHGSDRSVTEDASLCTEDIQELRLKLQKISQMADNMEVNQCPGGQCTRRPPSCAAGGGCDVCWWSLVAAGALCLVLLYWILWPTQPPYKQKKTAHHPPDHRQYDSLADHRQYDSLAHHRQARPTKPTRTTRFPKAAHQYYQEDPRVWEEEDEEKETCETTVPCRWMSYIFNKHCNNTRDGRPSKG